MTVAKKSQNRPPGRLAFFAFLETFLNPNCIELSGRAYGFSKYGHAKQKRKDGTRFFDHPKSATWIYVHELGGRDWRVIVLLLLHDLREDTFLLSSYAIRINFGRETALDVYAVTKIKDETFEESMQRVVARGARTILAKLCDRLHNLRTLAVCSLEMQREQIVETREVLMPMLLPAFRSCGKKWSAYADILEAEMEKAMAAIEAT